MPNDNHNDLFSFIWKIADSLRGAFKQSQYGRIILPFAVLRRLECLQEPHAEAVNKIVKASKGKPTALREAQIQGQTGLPFHNTTMLNLGALSESNTARDLNDYIAGFSSSVAPIFEHFRMDAWIADLDKAGLLYAVTQKFATIDLSLQTVSNREMGLVFEHLIRKFAESSNETAGEHFTPRDVVELATQLVIQPDADALRKEGQIRTIYDGAAGMGGFLSMASILAKDINPDLSLSLYGQEVNPKSYAIGMADMLLLGQDPGRYKLGNTLSDDQFLDKKFNYGLTNPPFGVNWENVKKSVQNEHKRGFAGRFGAGLPTIRDSSLLFLQNMWAKRTDPQDGGSRLAIILSGSPLFNGSAGSGESEVRRWILEHDWLETIVALPTNLFYNTGIGTYIWVLSNTKPDARKNKVQLIDATDLETSMRKSLGDKRQRISDQDIQKIIDLQGAFTDQDEAPKSKIFDTQEFGYRKITIQRPLRLRFEITQEALEEYAQRKTARYVEELAELVDQTFDTQDALIDALKLNKKPGKTHLKAIYRYFGEHHDDAPIIWKDKKKQEPEADTSLKETENVPLGRDIHEYFDDEVKPHILDAWIDTTKVDEQDGEVGIVGYEINFNRYFYVYEAPRPLADIDADLKAVQAEIDALLKEVAE